MAEIRFWSTGAKQAEGWVPSRSSMGQVMGQVISVSQGYSDYRVYWVA